MSGGYDQRLFLNPKDIEDYICVICQDVFKNATSISCTADHMFCESCLKSYFGAAKKKRCPSCRDKVLRNDIKNNKFTDRIIGKFKIKCMNQMKEEQQKAQIGICKWNGCLSELKTHLSNYCPLTLVQCKYCNKYWKRSTIYNHNNFCSYKPIECILLCGEMIPRRNMVNHIDKDCVHKVIVCLDCNKDFKRKDIEDHVNKCPEQVIQCIFAKYGCNIKIKRKLLADHLKNEEVNHLKMKITSLEDDYKTLQGKVNCERQIVMVSKISGFNLCSFSSKSAVKLYNKPKKSYLHQSCIGRDVSYTTAKQYGFNSNHLSLWSNNLIFSFHHFHYINTKLSIFHINSKECLTFDSDEKKFKSFTHYNCIYSNRNGLLIVGGEINYEDNPFVYCVNIDSVNKHFSTSIKTKMIHGRILSAYTTLDPALSLINADNQNEKLFVVGGKKLKTCKLFDFSSQKCINTKDMNYSHRGAGTYYEETQNKLVVGGGYKTKKVEEYDFNNDLWRNLPDLTNEYKRYPVLFSRKNNVLLCVADCTDDTGGTIEMYDVRNSTKKWEIVDSVSKYFNLKLPQDKLNGMRMKSFLLI